MLETTLNALVRLDKNGLLKNKIKNVAIVLGVSQTAVEGENNYKHLTV